MDVTIETDRQVRGLSQNASSISLTSKAEGKRVGLTLQVGNFGLLVKVELLLLSLSRKRVLWRVRCEDMSGESPAAMPVVPETTSYRVVDDKLSYSPLFENRLVRAGR